jgi:ParB family chromosome partitioning protein
MPSQNSNPDNDSSKISGKSVVSNTSELPAKAVLPQVPAGKLGRGLGRLIPVKNTTDTASNTSFPVIDSKPPVSAAIANPTSAPISDSRVNPVINQKIKDLEAPSFVFGKGVDQIEVSKIKPNPRQPRTDFKAIDLESLAASIKSNGLIQPIIVRPLDGFVGQYEIVAGERRWRAFKMLGKSTISAIVIQASDESSGVSALIENVHRTDLNPMDRANAILKLSEEFSLTHDKLAEKLSLDRSTVTNLLRLAELDSVTAGMVRQGLISQGHAKALLGVLDIKTRTTLAESTVRGEWSVRALEREVQRLSSDAKGRVPRGTLPARRQANVKDLETRLSQLLGTRVSIQLGRKPNTGKVSMEFFSLDQFEGMLAKLGLRTDQIRFEN